MRVSYRYYLRAIWRCTKGLFGSLRSQSRQRSVTVEDPNVLTMPVTVKFTELLIPNSDILEHFCAEGERDRAHMPTGDQ